MERQVSATAPLIPLLPAPLAALRLKVAMSPCSHNYQNNISSSSFLIAAASDSTQTIACHFGVITIDTMENYQGWAGLTPQNPGHTECPKFQGPTAFKFFFVGWPAPIKVLVLLLLGSLQNVLVPTLKKQLKNTENGHYWHIKGNLEPQSARNFQNFGYNMLFLEFFPGGVALTYLPILKFRAVSPNIDRKFSGRTPNFWGTNFRSAGGKPKIWVCQALKTIGFIVSWHRILMNSNQLLIILHLQTECKKWYLKEATKQIRNWQQITRFDRLSVGIQRT